MRNFFFFFCFQHPTGETGKLLFPHLRSPHVIWTFISHAFQCHFISISFSFVTIHNPPCTPRELNLKSPPLSTLSLSLSLRKANSHFPFPKSNSFTLSLSLSLLSSESSERLFDAHTHTAKWKKQVSQAFFTQILQSLRFLRTLPSSLQINEDQLY